MRPFIGIIDPVLIRKAKALKGIEQSSLDPRKTNEAFVAVTILTAESNPDEMAIIIKLISDLLG